MQMQTLRVNKAKCRIQNFSDREWRPALNPRGATNQYFSNALDDIREHQPNDIYNVSVMWKLQI